MYIVVDELGLHDKDNLPLCCPIKTIICMRCYFTFSDKTYNGYIHDYEIIDETDPYYWNVDEFASNFRQEIAGHAAIDDVMTTATSDYPAQPTRLLDMSEIDIHLPPASVAGIINRSFENQTTSKPAYRKTPVPTRKLMGKAGSVEIEVDTKPMYEHIPPLCTSQPTNNKHRSNATNTHFAEKNSLTLAKESNTNSALEEKEAPILVGTKEALLSPPVYCNIDMEDAMSVHEVYTICIRILFRKCLVMI